MLLCISALEARRADPLQTRFAINARTQWDNDDGDFIGQEFNTLVMTAFLEDDDWHDELVEWWSQ